MKDNTTEIERLRKNSQKVLAASINSKQYRVPFTELYQTIEQQGEEKAGELFQQWAKNMPGTWLSKPLADAGKKLQKKQPIENAMKILKTAELKNTNLLSAIEGKIEHKGNDAITYMSGITPREYNAIRESAGETFPMFDNDYQDNGVVPQWFSPGTPKVNKAFMEQLGPDATAMIESLGLPAEVVQQVVLQAQEKAAKNPHMHPTQAVAAVAQEIQQSVMNKSNDISVKGNVNSIDGRDRLIRDSLSSGKGEPIMNNNDISLAPEGGHIQLNRGGRVHANGGLGIGLPEDDFVTDNRQWNLHNLQNGWNVDEGRAYTHAEGLQAGTVDAGPMKRIHGNTAIGTNAIPELPQQANYGPMHGIHGNTNIGANMLPVPPRLTESAPQFIRNTDGTISYNGVQYKLNQHGQLVDMYGRPNFDATQAFVAQYQGDSAAQQQDIMTGQDATLTSGKAQINPALATGLNAQQKAIANQVYNAVSTGNMSVEDAHQALVDSGVSSLRARSMLGIAHSQHGQSAADIAAKRKSLTKDSAGRTGASTAADDRAQVQYKVIGTRVSDGVEVVEYRDGTIAVRQPDGTQTPINEQQRAMLEAEIANPTGGQFKIDDEVLKDNFIEKSIANGLSAEEALQAWNNKDNTSDNLSLVVSQDDLDESIKNSHPGSGDQAGASTQSSVVNNAINNAEGHAKNVDQLIKNMEREMSKIREERKGLIGQSMFRGLGAYLIARLLGANFEQGMEFADRAMKSDMEFLDKKMDMYSGVIKEAHLLKIKKAFADAGYNSGTEYAPSNLEKEITFLEGYYNKGGFGEVGSQAAIDAFNSAKNNTLNSAQAAINTTAGKEQAKSDQAQVDKDVAKYISGNEALSRYETLSSLLGRFDSNAISGNDFVITFNNVRSHYGLGGDTAKTAEAARAQIAALLVTERSKLAGQGTITDGETKMLGDTLPSIQNTPLGNKLIIETNKLYIQRNRQTVQRWNDIKLAAAGEKEAQDRTGLTMAQARKKLELGYQTFSIEFARKNRSKWEGETRAIVKEVQNWNKFPNAPTLKSQKEAIMAAKGGWRTLNINYDDGTSSQQQWRYVDGKFERKVW